MSSASDRRKSSGGGDEGGGANWMDTYGDLVTLLLTFFVLLFSFSNIDAAKWEALVGSFTGMSVIGVDPISPEIAFEAPIPVIAPRSAAADADSAEDGETPDFGEYETNLEDIYYIFSNYLHRTGIEANIEVYPDEYILRLIFGDQVFFETASAVVRDEAFPTIDAVIEMFLEIDDLYDTLIVEGHTDDRPINTTMYPSNWHVSVYRAVNVVSYIRDDGRVDTSRITAVGYGEERPVAPNDSPENMALNRRVEFVVQAGARRGGAGR